MMGEIPETMMKTSTLAMEFNGLERPLLCSDIWV